jgi:5'-phosphate synthase pdxT subunit
VATVGVLALQGDFEAHERALRDLGHEVRRVKAPEHLAGIAALVLPGGESSSMLKLANLSGLTEPLAAFCRSGAPVLGTCAGAILLARAVSSPAQASLGALDIDVERNGYGRQRESFVTRIDAVDAGLPDLECVFIRAPVIRRVGPGVDVRARHAGLPVLVRQGPVWAATFHPELSSDPRLLRRVLEPLGA